MKKNTFSTKVKSFVLSLVLILSIIFSVNADGTKQVMPNSGEGTAIYISPIGNSGPYKGAPDSDRLFFSIADAVNENLYFGAQPRFRNAIFATPPNQNEIATNVYYEIFDAATNTSQTWGVYLCRCSLG